MRSLNLDQLRIFLAWSSAEVLCRGTACMVSNSNGALTKLWCDRFVACSNHGPIGQITQPSRCDDRCAFRLAGILLHVLGPRSSRRAALPRSSPGAIPSGRAKARLMTGYANPFQPGTKELIPLSLLSSQ